MISLKKGLTPINEPFIFYFHNPTPLHIFSLTHLLLGFVFSLGHIFTLALSPP